MNNQLQSNGHPGERRLIESDFFPFEFISQLAEMESWRKEVYRPIYHIHKWWAKRLGSVFRGILLGSALPDSGNLIEEFYKQHDFAGVTVFDPFMGIRHMFAHHILKPERVPIEGNVWGTSKSSGSFSTLFRSRLLRAIEYHSAPFELEIDRTNGSSKGKRVFGGSAPFTGRVETKWPPSRLMPSRAIYLSCGSSASTGLADASVDLVVTDPPFFDNVHYSELADFFFAWQQLGPSPFVGKRLTTRHPEEVQDTSAEQFAAKLRAVFAECHRVMRKDGLLVFTYHHSRMDGWTSLADAVVGAGFAFVNCHPVKSELSVAAPKSQAKEPIQLDVVLVCRKQTADIRKRSDTKIAFQRAVERATLKASRLKGCGLALSVNDRRVILISQFLVETCAGRSAEQLSDALSSSLTDLDLAAMRLLDSQTTRFAKLPKRDERQLALFDKERTKRHSTDTKRIATPVSYRRTRRRLHQRPAL
jgi:hypothetical protein